MIHDNHTYITISPVEDLEKAFDILESFGMPIGALGKRSLARSTNLAQLHSVLMKLAMARAEKLKEDFKHVPVVPTIEDMDRE